MAIALVAMAFTAAAAQAASTRAEYVAQVDPVCQQALMAEKTADKTFHRRIKKAEQQLKLGRHPKAARSVLLRYYGRLRQIDRNLDGAIAPIPPAPGDEPTIQTWLAQRERSIDLQRRAMRALRGFKLRRYFHFFFGALRSDFAALDTVRDFGFAYCGRVSAVGPLPASPTASAGTRS
jgi:hypothetical protein